MAIFDSLRSGNCADLPLANLKDYVGFQASYNNYRVSMLFADLAHSTTETSAIHKRRKDQEMQESVLVKASTSGEILGGVDRGSRCRLSICF